MPRVHLSTIILPDGTEKTVDINAYLRNPIGRPLGRPRRPPPNVTPMQLRTWRRAQGLTRERCGIVLGASASTIANWENGKTIMPATAIDMMHDYEQAQRDQRAATASAIALAEDEIAQAREGASRKPTPHDRWTGADLRQWRKSRNLTQWQLAFLLDVMPSTISAWETGTTRLPIDFLTRAQRPDQAWRNELIFGKG